MEEDHSSKKIWFIVGGIVILLIAAATVYVLFSKQGSDGTGTTKGVGSLFGFIGTDVGRPVTGDIRPGSLVPDGTVTSGAPDEALFRQLSTIQIAGATAVVRDGKTLVRYVSRENGFIYEADPVTGTSRQLTNTTVPRIYEAFWGNNGQTVVLRFLQKDPLTNRDVIKTQIGDLALPISTTTAVLGSLEGLRDRLPDNISQVSISRKGAYLFYLLPVTDGVSGTIVTLANRIPKEVLRLSFSEWLPSMLDDGNVILTTKPSAEVPGFAYLYDTGARTLSRILREKNGLTTEAGPSGKRVLYGENVSGNTFLSMYDRLGFSSEEGDITHTEPLQLATLPEKCAWAENAVRIFCGAFAATPHKQVPDEWYQGLLAFQDTFWTINTDNSEIVFLADPKKEINRSFDVLSAFTGGDEKHFFFIDKNDFTLWSMRLMKEKYESVGEVSADPALPTAPALTPEELKDAAGSSASTSVR